MNFTLSLGWGKGILSPPKRSDQLGPDKPSVVGVPEALFSGVKRPDRETDHSAPSSTLVKNSWS
jgi:hypothetical protein